MLLTHCHKLEVSITENLTRFPAQLAQGRTVSVLAFTARAPLPLLKAFLAHTIIV